MPKTILITGATDGIGRLTALALAGQGHNILVHGRTAEKVAATVDAIKTETGNNDIEGYPADLSDLDTVRAMARDLLAAHPKLDVLINNAGIGPSANGGRRTLSADGLELRFQVNYLATVLISELLLPLLQAARGRIVNLGSAAQEDLDLNDLTTEKGFSGMKAYARSKLAVVMYTFTLAERLAETGVTANAMDPGSMLATKMVAEMNAGSIGRPEDGAEREVYLATSPAVDGVSGKYFSDNRIAQARAQAYDNLIREALWAQTKRILNL